MNIIPFNGLSLKEKVDKVKMLSSDFIVNVLIMSEKCGLNRKNSEDFLILDKELEERARYSYKILGGFYES